MHTIQDVKSKDMEQNPHQRKYNQVRVKVSRKSNWRVKGKIVEQQDLDSCGCYERRSKYTRKTQSMLGGNLAALNETLS